MGFLSEHLSAVRERLAADPPDVDALEGLARAAPPTRGLAAALLAGAERDDVAMIAEVKRASPSAGGIAPVDPARQAAAYAEGGAAAISVLTEPEHFGGSLEDLRGVRAAVGVPVLRKDFLVDPVQVAESRAAGADAILVIVAGVDDAGLAALLAESARWGIEALVETHTDEDLERALATDARIVGVNARDLETLEVDVSSALERLTRIPEDRVRVLESGVADRADVEAARRAGAAAVLVGEALMRAADPTAAVRRLLGWGG
jgi:indole-3-glycerol phosphate synthase